MRKLLFIFIFGLIALPAIAQSSSEFNAEQLSLRSEIFNFVKQEGYMPELDSDGDVKFKSQGNTHYIRVSKTDKNPMYVIIYRQFNYPEDHSPETLVMATKSLNLYKGIKVLCFDKSFRIGAEMFVRDAEPVKHAFYKILEIIDDARADVIDECENVGTVSSSGGSSSISEIPFIITEMDVANVDKDNNIIQDFGSAIYDYKTQYLKPRITVKPIKSSGTYTLSIKLYKDNVLQRNTSVSPEDYTFTDNITINGSSSQVFRLSGWGSSTSGQWSIGTYRYEIWYNGYCIGSRKFKVI